MTRRHREKVLCYSRPGPECTAPTRSSCSVTHWEAETWQPRPKLRQLHTELRYVPETVWGNRVLIDSDQNLWVWPDSVRLLTQVDCSVTETALDQAELAALRIVLNHLSAAVVGFHQCLCFCKSNVAPSPCPGPLVAQLVEQVLHVQRLRPRCRSGLILQLSDEGAKAKNQTSNNKNIHVSSGQRANSKLPQSLYVMMLHALMDVNILKGWSTEKSFILRNSRVCVDRPEVLQEQPVSAELFLWGSAAKRTI